MFNLIEFKKVNDNAVEQNDNLSITEQNVNFTIRECTRNSKHKEYNYIGKRLSLNNPVVVEIVNESGLRKKIEYKFQNKLQKAPKLAIDEFEKGPEMLQNE